MKDMDRWLGDGGMPVIGAIGAAFERYGVDDEGAGWVEGSWTPTETACNPHGIVQAGVHAVVLDAAMNFAANASLDGRDRTKATLEMKTDLVRAAAKGDTYAFRGEVVRLTRQIAFAQSVVTDAEHRPVSRSTGTFLLHRES